MKKAVLEINSWSGNRESNISSAIRTLELLPNTTVIAGSGIYEAKSEDIAGMQTDSLSKCVVVLTELSPRALLGACLGIEASMDNAQDERFNRKNVTVNLLNYEEVTSSDAELELPYIRMISKPVVLVSLSELFKERKVLGYDFSARLKRTDLSNVRLF